MPLKKRQDPQYQLQAILSYRDHSVAEIRQKLRHKGFSQVEINAALGWAIKHKLVNDHTFAHRYAESILAGKPVGPRYLSNKLRQKGISSDLISSVIDEAYTGNREEELMQAAAKKWQKGHPQHAADRQRLFRFLLSRGFGKIGGLGEGD